MSNESSRPDLRGYVKKVLSGDTVIIRGQPRGPRAPDEWTKSLAFLNVPRLGKKPQPGEPVKPDEPYAWEAREFLRKKLVGKEVLFKFVYENKSNISNQPARECGILYLSEENLNETIVNEGYADVTQRKGFEANEHLIRLTQLAKEAAENGKGKHSGKEASVKREAFYEITHDDASTLEKKTFPGIVDDVLDGSTLRIFVQTAPGKYQLVTIMIAGIRCPAFRRENPDGEEFAKEAKYFTECCLLNRDVEVRLDQFNNNNKKFYGTVTSEGRDIAEYLLKQGLARILQQSISSSVNLTSLRAAEREAKQKRLKLFKDYVETTIDTKAQIYEVTEIINGDALKIKDLKTNKEKKIFLSSIRPPPRPENLSGKVKPLYDVPCMFEAREYLRKHLIGKKVQVVQDYIQQASKSIDPNKPDFPEKECCTVFIGDNKNIAEALVAKGLASVVKHKQDDPKSHCYDALYDAEQKAQKSKRGIYGKPVQMRVVDLSNDAPKAKQYYTFLNRGNDQSRLEAVVEYIYSASRVKVFVPKENCLLNLILAGINAPKSGEKIGDDALDFVRTMLHQRDVQITVDGMDKVGNYIGYLFYEGKNVSLELLRRGFAELRDAKSNQFIEAQKEAKEKRLNMWKDYVEKEETKDAEDEEEAEAATEVIEEKRETKKEKRDEVVITHVSPQLTSVYVQYVANGPKLDELLAELREELNSNPPLPGSSQIRKGEIVAAKFSADGLWYRAKVEKDVDSKMASVLFIDYGNRENVLKKDIAILPASKYGVNSDGPSPAKECALAFVEFPTDVDQLEEAYSAFCEDTRDKVLHMKREYTDPVTNLDCVTFLLDGKDVVLNLVNDGYVLVEKKRRERRLDKIFSDYKAAQETAKRKRLNLWQYGDFTEDDAKEFGAGKK